jgi:hypothetical protein
MKKVTIQVSKRVYDHPRHQVGPALRKLIVGMRQQRKRLAVHAGRQQSVHLKRYLTHYSKKQTSSLL